MKKKIESTIQLSDFIVIEREEFAASDEYPYTAKIKGIDITMCGESPLDAVKSLLNCISDYVRCGKTIKKTIHDTIGPL